MATPSTSSEEDLGMVMNGKENLGDVTELGVSASASVHHHHHHQHPHPHHQHHQQSLMMSELSKANLMSPMTSLPPVSDVGLTQVNMSESVLQNSLQNSMLAPMSNNLVDIGS